MMETNNTDRLARGGTVSTIGRGESHVWETVALFVVVAVVAALMLLSGGAG